MQPGTTAGPPAKGVGYRSGFTAGRDFPHHAQQMRLDIATTATNTRPQGLCSSQKLGFRFLHRACLRWESSVAGPGLIYSSPRPPASLNAALRLAVSRRAWSVRPRRRR